MCASCAATKVICEYSVPEGFSQRDAERQAYQQIKADSQANQEAVSKAKRELRALVDELRQNGQDSKIWQHIKDAPSLDDAVRVVSRTLDTAPQGADDSQEKVDEPMVRPQLRPGESSGYEIDLQPTEIDIARWTGSGEDLNGLLTHLLSLFWTWDNTVSPIIDRCMFLEDLQSDLAHSGNLPPGAKQLFCTPFLVNCVLAVACVSFIPKPPLEI